MIQEVTNGIEISIETKFRGTQKRNSQNLCLYEYFITIHNSSKVDIRLESRHWEIFDSLNFTEIVEGKGVIGIQPIIKSGGQHAYKSHCILYANFGTMKGHYLMQNLSTLAYFKVPIPRFQLYNNTFLN